jgi:hypothetical protein
MIVAVGRESTKQLSTFVGLDKRYEATIDLSLYTDTWDDEHWEERIVLEYDEQKVELLKKGDTSQAQHDEAANKGDTSCPKGTSFGHTQHDQGTVSSVILTKEGSHTISRSHPILIEITTILDSLL